MKSREKYMLGLLIRYAPTGVRKKKMAEELVLLRLILFFFSFYSFLFMQRL